MAVTSLRAEESAIAVDDECMVSGHIPKKSWVRCDKVFTLSGTTIVRSYGILKADVMEKVMAVVCDRLNCTRLG